MDFAWSDEQTQLRETVADFARAELNAGLIEREKRGEFNRDGWRKCAEMGVHGLPVPKEYGGMGLDALTTMGVLESLGYGCKDNGLVFSINAHMWTLEMPLLGFGTEEQKQRWLPGICSGELVTAVAMTEPGIGSDLASMSTTAIRDGDVFVVNGSKTFITNGVRADFLVCAVRTTASGGHGGISFLILEREMDGYEVSRKLEKLGWHSSDTGELAFSDVFVPDENLLGGENEGFKLIMANFQWERLLMALGAVGTMDWCLRRAVDYALERQAFGRPIGHFQAIRHKVAEMATKLEAGRAMTYSALRLLSSGRDALREVTAAKLFTQRAALEVADETVQVHGGYGYMREYEVERVLRDARLGPIGGGTDEVMKEILGRGLGL